MTTNARLVCVVATILALATVVRVPGSENEIRNSVVKISVVLRPPDLDRPWFRQNLVEASGTGVVISGNRILTAAHVVLYANQITVETAAGEKSSATVLDIARELDLACLKVEDEELLKNRVPLKFVAELPELQSEVNVYGYPIGGAGLSITKGIVSRINFAEMSEIQAPILAKLNRFDSPGLRIQVDAAMNHGNSGGPALVNGQVIGVARSILQGAGNIGYLTASQEIEWFLNGVDNGGYKAKPRILDEWQSLENRALRSWLKLKSTTTGVVVRAPFQATPDYPLKQWDVVQKIGEHEIDNSGTVQVRENLRLRFDYLLAKLAQDDKVPLTILRGDNTTQIQLPVVRESDVLMKSLNGKYPSYFVYGPLVFSRVSSEYVDASGPVWWALWGQLESPLIARRYSLVDSPGEELVAVAAQLPHGLLRGYKRRYTQTVKAVNGVRIHSFSHLIETLRELKDPSVTIEFHERDAETVVLSREETLAATEKILEDNGIPQQGSSDALKVWNAKAS